MASSICSFLAFTIKCLGMFNLKELCTLFLSILLSKKLFSTRAHANIKYRKYIMHIVFNSSIIVI